MREAETEIRKKYPEAAYIELEPDSSTHNLFALEHFQTPALRQVTPLDKHPQPSTSYVVSFSMPMNAGALDKPHPICALAISADGDKSVS